ncbi:MAG: family 16 glycosylhydrolase [Gammaproteobacteria bacterium]|nr:family 16 glycosylhydrolase [Gammaproteobacteria bacterium]
MNVGGPEHLGADGIHYEADKISISTPNRRIENIRGAQDSSVYKTYREGELRLQQPLANGIYDITLLFAEPYAIPVGSRVFDVLAENRVVIAGLDVRLARDGNYHAALVRTVVGVEVSDGQLDLKLKSVVGEPLLNALIVRQKVVDPASWRLVWSDEFDYQGAPDSNKWSYDIWPPKKVNDEDQAYTDRPKNVRVEDGKLVIEAHREDYGDAKYSSGRIHSKDKGDLLYGRADIRAKLAAGQGAWSAIWMLPSDPFKYSTTCTHGEDWQGSTNCDAWPNSGEIDIMEHVGYDMNVVHGTVHTRAYYWVNGKQRKASVEGQDVAEAFHVYSIEWSPDRIDILFDGSPYFTYLRESDDWQAWPFDHPYHVILNLAIGGAWGRAGGPIDNSIFPARLEVDYVRLYKPGTPNVEMQKEVSGR